MRKLWSRECKILKSCESLGMHSAPNDLEEKEKEWEMKKAGRKRCKAWLALGLSMALVLGAAPIGREMRARAADGSQTLTAVRNGYVQGNMSGKTASRFAADEGYLRVKYSNSNASDKENYNRRAYIEFDISSINNESEVGQALLELTIRDKDNNYSNANPYYVGTFDGDMDAVNTSQTYADWLANSKPADAKAFYLEAAGQNALTASSVPELNAAVAVPTTTVSGGDAATITTVSGGDVADIGSAGAPAVSQQADAALGRAAENNSANAGDKIMVDVTEMVKTAVAGSKDRITFCLFIETRVANNGVNICSLAESDSEKHPQLSIMEPVKKTIGRVPDVLCAVGRGEIFQPPTEVSVEYLEGGTGKAPVTWNSTELQAVNTNEIKTYTVTGTVDGYSGGVTMYVTVQENTSSTAYPEADTYVQAGSDAGKTGQILMSGMASKLQDRLRLKTTDGSNLTYTRRIAMRFDLNNLDREGKDQYVLTFQTHDGEQNNPGADFSSFQIQTFTLDGWTRDTLTWDGLENAMAAGVGTAVTVTAQNRVNTVQLDYPSYVYEVDVTEAVTAALEEGNTELSFVFSIDTQAANNQHDLFASTTTRDNVQKPALIARVAPMIKSVADVEIEVSLGEPPVLPAEVEVAYKTGAVGMEKVLWDFIPESSYADLGSFQVQGRLISYPDITVTAQVTVRYDLTYTGQTYYVSNGGNDANTGTSPDQAWSTLDKVNAMEFRPGDKILFEAGGIWNGYLRPRGNGDEGRPIVLSSYGDIQAAGRPLINGGGTSYSLYSATIMLVNQSYWEISNFEITNYGAGQSYGTRYNEQYVRAGIYLYTYDQSQLMKDLTVENCYVHDVVSNTTDSVANASPKMSGGIIALAEFRNPQGQSQAPATNNQAGFDGVTLQYNTVWRTMHEGIRTKVEGNYSTGYNRNNRNVSINNNYIEDTLGDGIVLGENAENGVVEYNVVNGSASINLNSVYYAAAWTHYATDVLFQYNEIYGTVYGQTDGQAFDADNNCYNSVFQYNYSHNNQGGALLLMSSQRNTVFRYNISAADAWGNNQEVFQDHSNNGTVNGAPIVYNNTIYIVKDNTYLFSSMNTRNSAEYVIFMNNIVDVKEGVTGLKFSKSNVGIAPGSTITNNLFSKEGDFGITDVSWPGNYYGDAQLANPEAYKDHEEGLAEGTRNLASVEDLKQDPLRILRERAANYIPQNKTMVEGRGKKIDGLELTRDMLGNVIAADTPSIGALEVAVHSHTVSYRSLTDSVGLEGFCSVCGETLGRAMLTSPANTKYDGSEKEAVLSFSHEWTANGLDNLSVIYRQGEEEISGAPVEPGEYTASIEAGGASATVSFKIEGKEEPQEPVNPGEIQQPDGGGTPQTPSSAGQGGSGTDTSEQLQGSAAARNAASMSARRPYTVAAASETEAFAVSQMVTKRHEETGIRLHGNMEDTWELSVVIAELAEGQEAATDLEALGEKIAAFNITLLLNGEPVQPYGMVEVRIPAPTGYDRDNLSVYYVDDEGNAEALDFRLENEDVVFETDHFSIYAVVENVAQETAVPETEEKEAPEARNGEAPVEEAQEPASNGQNPVLLFVLLAVVIAVAAVAGVVVYKKKQDQS